MSACTNPPLRTDPASPGRGAWTQATAPFNWTAGTPVPGTVELRRNPDELAYFSRDQFLDYYDTREAALAAWHAATPASAGVAHAAPPPPFGQPPPPPQYHHHSAMHPPTSPPPPNASADLAQALTDLSRSINRGRASDKRSTFIPMLTLRTVHEPMAITRFTRAVEWSCDDTHQPTLARTALNHLDADVARAVHDHCHQHQTVPRSLPELEHILTTLYPQPDALTRAYEKILELAATSTTTTMPSFTAAADQILALNQLLPARDQLPEHFLQVIAFTLYTNVTTTATTMHRTELRANADRWHPTASAFVHEIVAWNRARGLAAARGAPAAKRARITTRLQAAELTVGTPAHDAEQHPDDDHQADELAYVDEATGKDRCATCNGHHPTRDCKVGAARKRRFTEPGFTPCSHCTTPTYAARHSFDDCWTRPGATVSMPEHVRLRRQRRGGRQQRGARRTPGPSDPSALQVLRELTPHAREEVFSLFADDAPADPPQPPAAEPDGARPQGV